MRRVRKSFLGHLQIHDWFFHEFSDTESYKVKWGPKADNTFRLRKTIKDAEGYAANTETPWRALDHCVVIHSASGFVPQTLLHMSGFQTASAYPLQ